MKSLLIIEDDLNVRDPLANYLEKNGFSVVTVSLLTDARARLKQRSFDCVILDWNLPDGEGIELAKELRISPNAVPVLMLTARTDLTDKVVGLELGSNDYMTKPFEPRELLARLRNILRAVAPQGTPAKPQTIEQHGIEIDLISYEVRFRGTPVELTKKEFDLLKMLLENPGKTFARDELLNSVWGYDQFPNTRTIDTHVLQLRQKFFDDLIETVRGIGYRCKK